MNGYVTGIAGGAFFLLLSWALSTWLNWRVNDKVRREICQQRVVLEEIRDALLNKK